MFDKTWELYILVECRLMRQDFFLLYIVYFISELLTEIENGDFECLTWTSPLLIVGWCLHLCSEIQNQSPYPNHDSQAWCAFCLILFVHTPWCTRYTCSANTQSVQLSVRRFTRHQARLNDNKHCWLHIEVKQKYIVLILAIHHAQDQIILALRATDEVVGALYWVAERQEKARPSPESVGSITSRYSGNDPTLLSRRGGTRHSGGSRGGTRGAVEGRAERPEEPKKFFLETTPPPPQPLFYLSV